MSNYNGILADHSIEPIYLRPELAYILGRGPGKDERILRMAKGKFIQEAYRQELKNLLNGSK